MSSTPRTLVAKEVGGLRTFNVQAFTDSEREPTGDGQAGFLTAHQAAAYLGGLNHRTVTRWAREGYIPAIPIGEGKRRLWRFVTSDLHAWMLARRQHGQMPLDIQAVADTLVLSHRCSSREIYD